jgi:hypothetical protein
MSHRQHRAGRSNDTFDAAHQQVVESAPAVGAHHNQVDRVRPRVVDDGVGRRDRRDDDRLCSEHVPVLLSDGRLHPVAGGLLQPGWMSEAQPPKFAGKLDLTSSATWSTHLRSSCGPITAVRQCGIGRFTKAGGNRMFLRRTRRLGDV